MVPSVGFEGVIWFGGDVDAGGISLFLKAILKLFHSLPRPFFSFATGCEGVASMPSLAQVSSQDNDLSYQMGGSIERQRQVGQEDDEGVTRQFGW